MIEKNKSYKPIFYGFLIFLSIIFIFILVFVFFFMEGNFSGMVISDSSPNYHEGELIRDILRFSLKEGEFIPADLVVVINNSGEEKTLFLRDLVSEEESEGNFYLEGNSFLGNGSGYGILGKTIFFPLVNFVVLLSEGESSEEIFGEVSKEKPFEYSLSENVTVELLNSSQEINLDIQEGFFIVTTDYSKEEFGFGENFLGVGKKDLELDLSEFEFIPKEGNLRISFIYSGEEVLFLNKNVLKKEIIKEVIEEVIGEVGEDVFENVTVFEEIEKKEVEEKEIVMDSKIVLNEKDIQKLFEVFGDFSLEPKKRENIKGRFILRYELGDYWFEPSYSLKLSDNQLETQILEDKNRWLSDLFKSLN